MRGLGVSGSRVLELRFLRVQGFRGLGFGV